MLIAQFTDTHVTAEGERACGGAVDANGRLEAAIDALHGLDPRPDCLLVTGDLADHGRAEQYAMFRRLIETVDMPVHLAIGNHDDRRAMQAELPLPPEAADGPFVQYCVEEHPVRIVVLDSASDDHHMGELCDERLGWLRDRLAEQPDRPTVLAIHHPPFDVGIAFLDGVGDGWARGLVDLVAASPNVVLIVSGHVHRSVQTVVGGALVTVCPSTAQQTTLDLAEQPSADWLFAIEPPAFQLHHVDDGRVATHTVTVGEYEGVIPVGPEGRARWAASDPRVLLAKRRPG